jgi:hypothetical protein
VAPPQSFAQDDDVGRHGHVGRQERAAGDETGAEQLEEARCDLLRRDLFNASIGGAQPPWVVAGRGHGLERTSPFVPVPEGRRPDGAARRPRGALPDHDEALGVRVWQRPEQRGVDEGENGAVGANAEGERDRGQCREARRRPQLAQPDAHVARQFLEPSDAVHVVNLLAHEQRVSELPTGGVRRLALCHAEADVAFGE